MSIPPVNPSNWNSQVSASNSVETGAGGGSGAYAGGFSKKEQTDEVNFETSKNQDDELDLLENKGLITLIKEFFISLWTALLEIFGIRKQNK